jgi:pyruvate formate lyase activating enzyme
VSVSATITGTIFDIKRFAIHDGPGVRTTVFLKGCPLGCWLCHNPEGQGFGPEITLRGSRCNLCGDCVESCPRESVRLTDDTVRIDRARCDLCGACADVCLPGAIELAGREVTAAEVIEEIDKDTVYYDESSGGVTFSGGEPLSQADFLFELLRACKFRGLRTALDTCGYAPPRIFQRIAQHVDLYLYDLKVMNDTRHREFTCVSNESIHANLHWLAQRGASVVVRLPLLPGINDDRTNIRALGAFLASLPERYPVDVLPYHRTGIDKYGRLDRAHRLPDLATPSDAEIARAVRQLRQFDLDVTVKGEKT